MSEVVTSGSSLINTYVQGYQTRVLFNNEMRIKRSLHQAGLGDNEDVKNKSSVLVESIIKAGYNAHQTLFDLPRRKGGFLLKELTTYNKCLDEFVKLIKHDNINTRQDVETFLGQRHPNIAETDHKEWDVRTRFNWADDNYKQFQELMCVARELWIELIYLHAYY